MLDVCSVLLLLAFALMFCFSPLSCHRDDGKVRRGEKSDVVDGLLEQLLLEGQPVGQEVLVASKARVVHAFFFFFFSLVQWSALRVLVALCNSPDDVEALHRVGTSRARDSTLLPCLGGFFWGVGLLFAALLLIRC